MSAHEAPFVSVLTPVYNGAEFLAACIESVLGQDYQNYEYIIVNNASTDRTLEIAEQYAKKDKRIRIHNNERLVPVIDNHNIAFRLISPAARYCKVVSADDFLFPQCLSRLVECAEAHPTAGLVGSYQLSGAYIRWQGFAYPSVLVPGRELCRRVFLGDEKEFGFGTPTSLLYRADVVRAHDPFYPNASPHADTSACFEVLARSDFAFVHQVLSFEKTHEATQSFRSAQMNRYSSAFLNDVTQYGPLYLDEQEMKAKVRKVLDDYHRFLAVNWIFGSRDREFWQYHESRLRELGFPLHRFDLIKAAVLSSLKEMRNPELAFRKFRNLHAARPAVSTGAAAITSSEKKRVATAA
jgi:glycosyltransferase involved in cell wall biosynthesis